jgi:hypothetical protein
MIAMVVIGVMVGGIGLDGVVSRVGGIVSGGGGVVGRLCRDQQITTILGPAQGGGHRIGRHGQADSDERAGGV